MSKYDDYLDRMREAEVPLSEAAMDKVAELVSVPPKPTDELVAAFREHELCVCGQPVRDHSLDVHVAWMTSVGAWPATETTIKSGRDLQRASPEEEARETEWRNRLSRAIIGQCDPLKDAVDQFLRQKFRHVYEHREHLCEAWIAETGLLPSESVLCTQDVVGPDGTVVTRCWIEKKRT